MQIAILILMISFFGKQCNPLNFNLVVKCSLWEFFCVSCSLWCWHRHGKCNKGGWWMLLSCSPSRTPATHHKTDNIEQNRGHGWRGGSRCIEDRRKANAIVRRHCVACNIFRLQRGVCGWKWVCGWERQCAARTSSPSIKFISHYEFVCRLDVISAKSTVIRIRALTVIRFRILPVIQICVVSIVRVRMTNRIRVRMRNRIRVRTQRSTYPLQYQDEARACWLNAVLFGGSEDLDFWTPCSARGKDDQCFVRCTRTAIQNSSRCNWSTSCSNVPEKDCLSIWYPIQGNWCIQTVKGRIGWFPVLSRVWANCS